MLQAFNGAVMHAQALAKPRINQDQVRIVRIAKIGDDSARFRHSQPL